MSKLSLSDVIANEEAGMLALSAAPVDVPAYATHKAEAQSANASHKLNLEVITGMKIVQPMRIHRYRHG